MAPVSNFSVPLPCLCRSNQSLCERVPPRLSSTPALRKSKQQGQQGAAGWGQTGLVDMSLTSHRQSGSGELPCHSPCLLAPILSGGPLGGAPHSSSRDRPLLHHPGLGFLQTPRETENSRGEPDPAEGLGILAWPHMGKKTRTWGPSCPQPMETDGHTLPSKVLRNQGDQAASV